MGHCLRSLTCHPDAKFLEKQVAIGGDFLVFNTVINHLRRWCVNKAEFYRKRYTDYGGIAFVGYQIAYELEFKLLTLIDKSFENAEALKKEIMNLIDVHYEPSVIRPANRTAVHIIDKTNREFCEFLEKVLSENEFLAPVDLPYKRVIIGSEAAEIKDKFRLIWQYVNTAYWFPLIGEEPTEINDKFFIMFDRFEPYKKQMNQILGLPQEHIYCYGESTFRPEHCIETSELIEYGGCEMIYTDKDFSWAIYFSHEFTVSFAVTIVPKAQNLLLKEKPYWNKFELTQF